MKTLALLLFSLLPLLQATTEASKYYYSHDRDTDYHGEFYRNRHGQKERD
jgi:hypothetical protein